MFFNQFINIKTHAIKIQRIDKISVQFSCFIVFVFKLNLMQLNYGSMDDHWCNTNSFSNLNTGSQITKKINQWKLCIVCIFYWKYYTNYHHGALNIEFASVLACRSLKLIHTLEILLYIPISSTYLLAEHGN